MSARMPPLMKKKCKTCPWSEGSPHAHLKAALIRSGVARICHSTGPSNAISKRPGKPARLCRGARDTQLQIFASTGFLEAATDEAWAKKWKQLQQEQSCPKPSRPKKPSRKD